MRGRLLSSRAASRAARSRGKAVLSNTVQPSCGNTRLTADKLPNLQTRWEGPFIGWRRALRHAFNSPIGIGFVADASRSLSHTHFPQYRLSPDLRAIVCPFAAPSFQATVNITGKSRDTSLMRLGAVIKTRAGQYIAPSQSRHSVRVSVARVEAQCRVVPGAPQNQGVI